jgi:hypothetical protein
MSTTDKNSTLTREAGVVLSVVRGAAPLWWIGVTTSVVLSWLWRGAPSVDSLVYFVLCCAAYVMGYSLLATPITVYGNYYIMPPRFTYDAGLWNRLSLVRDLGWLVTVVGLLSPGSRGVALGAALIAGSTAMRYHLRKVETS